MTRDQRLLLIMIAILLALPLLAWGGCHLADPVFGNHRIVFHGRVVDEAGRPLAGVPIAAEVRRHRRLPDLSLGWNPNMRYTVPIQATTDSDGQFKIRARGFAIRAWPNDRRSRWEGPGSTYELPFVDYPPGLQPRPDDPENPVTFRRLPPR